MDLFHRKTAAEEAVKGKPDVVELLARHDIERLVAALRRDDVGLAAQDALIALADPAAVPPLIGCLDDDDVAICRKAAVILGELRDPRAVEPLLGKLDADSGVEASAAKALGELGDRRAVEPLVEKLSADDAFVFSRAAEALRKIGDPRAIDALATVLDGENDFCARRAAMALGMIHDARAEAALAARFDGMGASPAALGLALQGRDDAIELMRERVRGSTIYGSGGDASLVLAAIGDRESVPLIVAALERATKSSCANDAEPFFEALGLLGDDQAVEPLVALAERNPYLFAWAGEALGRIGDRRALPTLVNAMRRMTVDPNRYFSELMGVVKGLGLLGNELTVESLRDVLQGLGDDPWMQANVAIAIRQIEARGTRRDNATGA